MYTYTCRTLIPQGHCGTFVSTTAVLHKMPLSIHGHAAHKRIMACNHAFSVWSKTRDKQRYFKALLVFHIWVVFFLFLFSYQDEGLCFRDSHSFSWFPPSQSQSAGCRCPVRFTWVWWAGGWGKPSSSHFLSMCFWLASFYPKAKTFRPVQSSAFECLYYCFAVVLLFRRHYIK